MCARFFGFEDFAQIRGATENARIALAGEQRIHDRPVWLLDARPDPGVHSTYDRLRIYVDQEYCLPLRTEFIGSDGEIRKILSASPDHITREGRHFIPRRFLMRDLRDQTQTRIALDDIRVDHPPATHLFTVRGLAAGGD